LLYKGELKKSKMMSSSDNYFANFAASSLRPLREKKLTEKHIATFAASPFGLPLG
jgi:hypothetical protein